MYDTYTHTHSPHTHSHNLSYSEKKKKYSVRKDRCVKEKKKVNDNKVSGNKKDMRKKGGVNVFLPL